ncbi:MAG: ABC transporter permease, partial [Ktedonobacteraceae bacterium]|nr:ABC transporter permease [Ktedonobacteraceae bacterium]
YMLLVGIYAFSGTIIGLIAGMFVGYALTAYISSVLNLDIGGLRLEPGIIVPGILVGLGTPLLAAVGPVYTGMRITVHQALSGYGIQAKSGGTGKRSQVLRSVLAFLPQQVHFAFRSLFRKRARLILTLAGLSITCSVFLAALVGISSLGASATSLLQTYHVEVEVVLSQPRASQQLENVISSINGVSLVEHSIGIPAKIGSEDVRLIGLEAKNHFYISHLQAGRWLTPQDLHAAVINSHMASQLGLHVGDLFTLHDSLHTQQLRIVGITVDNNGVTPTSLGVVLTTVAQADAFARIATNASNTFMVQTTSQNPAEIDATAVRIEDKLESLNLLVKVQTTQQLIQTSQGELQTVSVLFAIAIATVALVGAMGLFNSLAMSILERRREIGILRSMGATTGTIIRIFWIEGTTIAFLSWIVALILGLVSAYGFVQVLGALLVPLPFTFNPWYLLWMLAFVLGVASVASIGPALAAGKIKIAQTLYYE